MNTSHAILSFTNLDGYTSTLDIEGEPELATAVDILAAALQIEFGTISDPGLRAAFMEALLSEVTEHGFMDENGEPLNFAHTIYMSVGIDGGNYFIDHASETGDDIAWKKEVIAMLSTAMSHELSILEEENRTAVTENILSTLVEEFEFCVDELD